MAYEQFAYWYDALNSAADYDGLAACLLEQLRQNDISGGLVADLGCGTGELLLRLLRAGYDMIGIDASVDMLQVCREKLEENDYHNVLLLCQSLAQLDLYGTIKAAVCTFDTLNHLPPGEAEKAIARTSLFLEPGGLFLFDVNTPYKHQTILGNNHFPIETADGLDAVCDWQNRYDPNEQRTHIALTLWQEHTPLFHEEFWEYSHSLSWLEDVCENNHLKILQKIDGETFSPVEAHSQRVLYTTKRI